MSYGYYFALPFWATILLQPHKFVRKRISCQPLHYSKVKIYASSSHWSSTKILVAMLLYNGYFPLKQFKMLNKRIVKSPLQRSVAYYTDCLKLSSTITCQISLKQIKVSIFAKPRSMVTCQIFLKRIKVCNICQTMFNDHYCFNIKGACQQWTWGKKIGIEEST